MLWFLYPMQWVESSCRLHSDPSLTSSRFCVRWLMGVCPSFIWASPVSQRPSLPLLIVPSQDIGVSCVYREHLNKTMPHLSCSQQHSTPHRAHWPRVPSVTPITHTHTRHTVCTPGPLPPPPWPQNTHQLVREEPSASQASHGSIMHHAGPSTTVPHLYVHHMKPKYLL